MRSFFLAAALLIAQAALAADPRMEFWNLTSSTITGLSLAPAGTAAFGLNQCNNDKDHEVDHDERLRLTGIDPGRYDVQVTRKGGRVCTAHNVEVTAKRVSFSLTDDDLKDCH